MTRHTDVQKHVMVIYLNYGWAQQRQRQLSAQADEGGVRDRQNSR